MMVSCLFGYAKREQQKTPNDARRVEGRRDGKKSTARRREESERIFRRHFFAREEKATTKRALGTRARKRRAAFGSGFPAFSGPLVSGADLFLLSLSLSPSSSRSSKTHRLGKPKSRSRRRRKSRNTRATSSACGPSSPAYSARCCPSRCKCAGINTGPYRKNLSANLNTAIRRI